MILQKFSIYDNKALAYLPPIYCTNTAVAKRMFQQAANEPGHNFNIHSSDFNLWHIGEWDDETALSTELPNHVNLGTAMSYRQDIPQTPEATLARIGITEPLTKVESN